MEVQLYVVAQAGGAALILLAFLRGRQQWGTRKQPIVPPNVDRHIRGAMALKGSCNVNVTWSTLGTIGTSSSAAPAANHQKVVHFMRHGEGLHNVRFCLESSSEDTSSPRPGGEEAVVGALGLSSSLRTRSLRDAALTTRGRSEAQAVQERARAAAVELVVVSPLTRALETATLAFDHCYNNDLTVPFIAHELIRCSRGDECDRRLALARLRGQHPRIDFDGLAAANDGAPRVAGVTAAAAECDDPQWLPEREPRARVAVRARAFLEWLRRRPERCIAVVSHSGFLSVLFNAVLVKAEEAGKENAGEEAGEEAGEGESRGGLEGGTNMGAGQRQGCDHHNGNSNNDAEYRNMCANWFQVSELRSTVLSFDRTGRPVSLS